MVGVADIGPFEVLILYSLEPRLFLGVYRDAENVKTLVGIVFVNLLEIGNLATARTAPAGPEVEKNSFFTFAELDDVNLITVNVFGLELGHLVTGAANGIKLTVNKLSVK